MSNLTQLALQALEDPESPGGLRTVACVCLLAAFEHGIEVPQGAHMAVWRFLLATEYSAAVMHRHELLHPEVARDAVRTLLDPDSGENAQELAIAVLRGVNVAAIGPEALFLIADRAADENRARRAAWLVERVHEERGLTPEFITALRDRLAGSDVAAVRVAAVEVGALLPRLDERFVAQMLNDPAPPVRTAVADILEKVSDLDKPKAAEIIRQHLAVEHHRTPIAAAHCALGSLIRSGRQGPVWEPPKGGEN